MKINFMPLVASICGIFLCVSVAQANSVYVHNRPLQKVVTINNTSYVPFSDLMKGLKRGWAIDERGVVTLKDVGNSGPTLENGKFSLVVGSKTVSVNGIVRDGQVWVPVRIAKDMGYELLHNPQTGIIDITKPRLISEADRVAQAEVDQRRSEREAKLAAEQEAERTALEERKKAMAELKAKRAAKAEDSSSSSSEEGTYNNELDAIGDKAAKEVASKQKDLGPVQTYSDLMKVQEQLDQQEAARRAAIRDVKIKDGEGSSEKAEEAPAPNVVVFAPRATPDYFNGRIAINATVKNIGVADATGLKATVTLLSPDGTTLVTRRLNRPSVAANAQWDIAESYEHIAGTEMPRGNYRVTVSVDYANKPATK